MKTFITFSLFFLSITAFGQSSEYRIFASQAGTATLTRGEATVKIDSITMVYMSDFKECTYFVVLTPIGNCGLLKLDEKGNDSFTVAMAGSGSKNGSFDYVVFLRYHPMPLNQKIQRVIKLTPAQQQGQVK